MTAQFGIRTDPVAHRVSATPRLQDVAPSLRSAASAGRRTKPIGQRLLERRAVDPGDLVKALAMQARQEARLGEILLCNRLVGEAELMAALAEQWQTEVADLDTLPPDVRLIDQFGAARCLTDGILPLRRCGSTVVLATTHPEKFAARRADLERQFGSVRMTVTTESALHNALTSMRNPALARRAECRVPAKLSCRDWNGRQAAGRIAAGCIAVLMIALAAPSTAFSLLAAWAILTLAATTGLKTAALTVSILQDRRRKRQFQPSCTTRPALQKLPVVSVMIPLFQEADVVGRLIRRLSRLAYPKELIDILLVVEEGDTQTASMLTASDLPTWMRVVTVPPGGVQTKPRALNYALDFCRGRFVGVWDAEDAPHPDQFHEVVRRFRECGSDVACLQGVLDYYNARTNWLSRCFTVEYASWFRVVLPGLQRLGLALPLGGTTLYFRREALERLGAWDAHNVTEDADLGMRLVRKGYRTEMLDTVTLEEANCRLLPWIRQRSRWLKGYAITWAVHMRKPRNLWKDLGARKFWGFQVLFLGTVSQFVLAPVLWSFWLLAFDLPHPLTGKIPVGLHWPLIAMFVLSELINLTAGAWAVRTPDRRFLIPWVATMHLYCPLAAVASYKALCEILTCPFFWDKTQHGIHDECD